MTNKVKKSIIKLILQGGRLLMLEIPESIILSKEINETLGGKVIRYVKANQSPHSFAWYHGNPDSYDELLSGKTIETARPCGGMLEIKVEDCKIVFTDGTAIRYYDDRNKAPKKHQLYIEFEDDSALVVTVMMYGGIWAFTDGDFKNGYYLGAIDKPHPLSKEFDYHYFMSLYTNKCENLSAKAFLATEQRIPGLGNGVLQDILFIAGIHPKRKMKDVEDEEFQVLYNAIKKVLQEMVDGRGRDTEKDIFGEEGRYSTYLSRKTYLTPCTKCGYEIRKANYMGGTIYFCEKCQK